MTIPCDFCQLNLASQSVLEGLNACFDHRAEIYIPELGMSFHVQHEKTKIFACQNPFTQGGGRKGLPKSFLNRFTQVNFGAVKQQGVCWNSRNGSPLFIGHICCHILQKNSSIVIKSLSLLLDDIHRDQERTDAKVEGRI